LSAHVSICVPSTGAWAGGFGDSLIALISCVQRHGSRLGVERYSYNHVAGSVISNNRHILADAALSDGATHVLYLDTDMVFPADTAFRLLAHKLPIVGANYVVKRIPAVPVSTRDGKRVGSVGKRGLEEVHCSGLGCVLIERQVFEKTPLPWFDVRWQTDYRDYKIEDATFYSAARDAGFSAMIDHDISQEVGHIGSYVYTIQDCAAE